MSHEVSDTLIMQKVNAHHREAFRTRFPGQLEHCLRLTAERLQACLAKPADMVLADPTTWPATATTVRDLAEALDAMHRIAQRLEHGS